ncbi:hypothetical protein LTR93_011778 [Exophiala xenobiotica]|nr:hypothetical protein LTR93_011778 [Exophiala xenobiotica]
MGTPIPVLSIDGKQVDRPSEFKRTAIDYPATEDIPEVHAAALPLRPLGEHVPAQGVPAPVAVPKDRGLFADPSLPSMFPPGNNDIKRTDLTPSLGTLISGLQLSKITDKQKDELALLLAHRGVIFFRDQDITADQQRELFAYYGHLATDPDPETGKPSITTIHEQEEDLREAYVRFHWPFADFHADGTFQVNPPSYSLLRIEELPPTGGDTNWISGYGTYETLSKPLQRFVDGLKAWHSSELVYESTLNQWGAKPSQVPYETLHPVVATHPVTGYKVLNLNSGFVRRIEGLKRYESDKVLELLYTHIHTAQDHLVRFRWEKNSVAFWDNRAVTHRATHDYAPLNRRGARVTIKGQVPTQKPGGVSRREAVIKDLKEGKVNTPHNANLREGNYRERGFPKA